VKRIRWYVFGAIICWAFKNHVARMSQRLCNDVFNMRTPPDGARVENGIYWIVSSVLLVASVTFAAIAMNRAIVNRKIAKEIL
jgi:hypothetical protein